MARCEECCVEVVDNVMWRHEQWHKNVIRDAVRAAREDREEREEDERRFGWGADENPL